MKKSRKKLELKKTNITLLSKGNMVEVKGGGSTNINQTTGTGHSSFISNNTDR